MSFVQRRQALIGVAREREPEHEECRDFPSTFLGLADAMSEGLTALGVKRGPERHEAEMRVGYSGDVYEKARRFLASGVGSTEFTDRSGNSRVP